MSDRPVRTADISASVRRSLRTNTWILRGGAASFLIVAALIVIAPGFPVWLALIPVLVAALFGLLERRERRTRADYATVAQAEPHTAHALLRLYPDNRRETIRWDALTEVTVAAVGGVARLTADDGRRYSFDDFRADKDQRALIDRFMAETLAPYLRDQALDRLAAGETLTYGPFQITAEAITRGEKTVPISVLQAGGGWPKWAQINSNTPNALVWAALLNHLAAVPASAD
ncbi:MAG: hypothetical protein GYB67_14675 [Chloroflexi bacterium]|nr:hypothetical protein [Chloroflexota bacterium]